MSAPLALQPATGQLLSKPLNENCLSYYKNYICGNKITRREVLPMCPVPYRHYFILKCGREIPVNDCVSTVRTPPCLFPPARGTGF